MSGVTIGRALRLFFGVEAVGLAIVILGMVMGMNALLLSLGGLVMIPGFVFLTVAGTLKAQERALESARRQAETEGEHVGEAET
jgi:hypothetical protein